MAKTHTFICKNGDTAANAENAFMRRILFYPVTTEEPTDCLRILLTG